MTADKSYKPAVPVTEALSRIEQAAGTPFDSAVARSFQRAQREAI